MGAHERRAHDTATDAQTDAHDAAIDAHDDAGGLGEEYEELERMLSGMLALGYCTLHTCNCYCNLGNSMVTLLIHNSSGDGWNSSHALMPSVY